jgi:hypothetical protein
MLFSVQNAPTALGLVIFICLLHRMKTISVAATAVHLHQQQIKTVALI